MKRVLWAEELNITNNKRDIGIMGLIIDLKNAPPNVVEIEGEKKRLEEVLYNKRKWLTKIDLILFCVVVGIYVCLLILFVIDIPFFVVLVGGAVSVAILMFVDISYISDTRGELDKIKYSLESLDDIDPYLSPEILRLCMTDEHIRRYQNKLVTINRPMIHVEYLAMKQWEDDEKTRIKAAEIEKAKTLLKQKVI